MSFEIHGAEPAELAPLAGTDAPAVGALVYRAISRSFREHGLLEPIADEAEGERLARSYLELDPGAAVVARRDGEILGAGFLHVRDEVASIGPLVVDPAHQGQGVGGRLFAALSERAQGCAASRLFVDSFNMRAVAIPLRHGYVPRDLGLRLAALGGLRGPGMAQAIAPAPVRDLSADDIAAVVRFDGAGFGGSRERDFRALLAAGAVGLIAADGPAVRGFLFGRVEGSLALLGPGAADSPDLLGKLLARLGDRLAPRSNIVLACLLASQAAVISEALAMGFRATSLSVYMVRGAATLVQRPAAIGLPPDVV